jgi:Zn-dependent M16 (insulinase) family peptidase
LNTHYQTVEKRTVPQIKSEATILSHESGARIIILKNKDENKVFSVSFKTPPQDDTGLFHIMEHSVLAGSEKYPVKEPFNELVKGSLFTYLNAMTFSDKTMYPIGSCNDQDFFNLMNVYLDAVFFPKIYERKESFLQEGWRYQLKEKTEPLTRSGIVFSEMKGAYSDPLRVLDHIANRQLFPENAYRFDSGGNPDAIPALSHESFLAAHRKYYHPANSYIYFYGDVDADKCLDLLHNDYLRHFHAEDFHEPIAINRQSDSDAPILCEGAYAIPSDASPAGKNYLSANFIVGDYTSAEDYYAFKLLTNILIGTPASPLKKRLIDGGFGEEILGGFDSDMLETVFTVTAKNSEKTLSEFKAALEEMLKDLAENGIDKTLIESCVSKADFLYREEDYGYRPKGLVYNIVMLSGWLHGGDPLEKLESRAAVARIKEKTAAENYFEALIQTRLLNSRRAVYAALLPEPGFNERHEKETAAALSAYKNGLSEKEIDTLIAQSEALAAYQEKKDAPADLLKIPFVALADVKKEPEDIPFSKAEGLPFALYCSPLETNGILYQTMLFSTEKVPESQRYAIGLLSDLLGKLATKKRGYESLSNEINSRLGGFSIEFRCINDVVDVGRYQPFFVIKTKCARENAEEPFRLVGEILRETLFHDKKRIKTLLTELKSRLSNAILTSGHVFAMLRAESYATAAGKYSDDITGISFYAKLAELTANFDDAAEKLAEDLRSAAALLFNRDTFSIDFVCEKEDEAAGRANAQAFYALLDDRRYPNAARSHIFNPPDEAFATSGRVQYNVSIDKTGIGRSGHLFLLSNIISRVYFMDEIRLKGGAYGFGSTVSDNGLCCFHSYRDPRLGQTYAVYQNTADFIRRLDADKNEMRKHILGAVNQLDRYLQPKDKGALALKRYLGGKTDEMLRKEREEILSATPADFSALIEIFEKRKETAMICTFGSAEKIAQEKELFKTVHVLDL